MAKVYTLCDEPLFTQYKSAAKYTVRLIRNTQYVLCKDSAAKISGLANWNMDAETHAYELQECIDQNIPYENHNGILFTTTSQTINDILSDDDIDEQIIYESLAEILTNPEYGGIKNLKILPCNLTRYQYYLEGAKDYYNY